MLPAIFPKSFEYSAIWPLKHSVAHFLIIRVFSGILTPVRPQEPAIAFHFIKLPLALVHSFVVPGVLALAVNHVFIKLALVLTALVPLENSKAVLASSDELPFVD